MKKLVKEIARKLGIEITRYNPIRYERKIISLKSEIGNEGDVLLSYVIEPFLLKDGEPISNAHTHDWESMQIARTFLGLGYSVDVIDYRDSIFIPQKDYSFFVGARTNFERITQLLKSNCVKIVHLDTAHWTFNNYASYRRTLELQQRKGITIKESQRIVEQNLAIEYTDYATILGNQFTIKTYCYAQKPIYRIPVSTCAVYPWSEDRDFDSCRRNFLWFGSSGFVHKGLDLVLDAFAEMQDYQLTICGPIQQEKDFEKAYYKELYQSSNIHTIGWVDVNSPEFIKIAHKCIGLVYPSCSEGGGGSIINCMHAGLIPIVSYESSVDVDDSFGVILKNCSIDEIKIAVEKISNLPANKLKSMCLKTWEFARANHTREKFAEEYRHIVDKIISADDGNERRTPKSGFTTLQLKQAMRV